MEFAIPVAAGSKTWTYCRSLAGTVVSNPTGWHGCLLWVSCVLSGKGVWDGPITRPGEGVLPTVVFLSVIVKSSTVRLPWPTRGCRAMKKNMRIYLTKLKDLPFEIHLERKLKSGELIVLGYCVYRFVY